MIFDKEKRKVLLDIAKKAILEVFEKKKLIDKEELIKKYPWLNEKGAVFVTLNKNNHLRGCIGSILAYRPLIDDLIANAKAAAFNDPRFTPLQKEEIKDLDIEISILTPPKLLEYRDIEDLKRKIKPFRDGVILKYGNFQATYLPSVWEQIPSFDLFFQTLCQKAGLMRNCLELHPTIYTYEAIKIKDE